MRVPLVNTCGAISGVVTVKTIQRVRRTFSACRLAVFSETFHHGLLTPWLHPRPSSQGALRGTSGENDKVWCEPSNGPRHNPCLAKYLATPAWATSTAVQFLNASAYTRQRVRRPVVAVHMRGLAASKCGDKLRPARPCCIPTAANVVQRLHELGYASPALTAVGDTPLRPSGSSNMAGVVRRHVSEPAAARPLVFVMVDGTRAMTDAALAITGLLGSGCCTMISNKWLSVATAAGADSTPEVTRLLLDM